MGEWKPIDSAPYVIFCDDVRQEVGNKLTVVGMYTGDLLMHSPTMPAVLPKFCVLVTYIQSIAARRNAKLEIFLPGDPADKPTAAADVPMADIPTTGKNTRGEDSSMIIARMVIAFGPATFNQPGKIRVSMRYEDDTILQLGELNVVHTPPVQPEPA